MGDKIIHQPTVALRAASIKPSGLLRQTHQRSYGWFNGGYVAHPPFLHLLHCSKISAVTRLVVEGSRIFPTTVKLCNVVFRGGTLKEAGDRALQKKTLVSIA